MTLREEVLKNSGLLVEDVLEEGAFKKALITAAVIAGLAGSAIVGPKGAKEVKQYKSVKNVPVATRYEKINNEMQHDIEDKEYMLTPYTVQKVKYVSGFHVEYNDRNNQAIIYIDVRNNELKYPSLVKSDLNNLINDYLKYIDEQSSKIEDKISPEKFNKFPLKVVVTREISEDDKYQASMDAIANGIEVVTDVIRSKLGTMAIEWRAKHI